MPNVILIPTCNLFRMRMLMKYYNVYGVKTEQHIVFIGDDRGSITQEQFKAEVGNKPFELVFMSDVIQGVGYFYEDCPYYNEIMNRMYKVSVKLLIFVWAYHCRKLRQSMLLDDDVLFLRPIDDWFKHEYVVKEDGLSVMGDACFQVLKRSYPGMNVAEFNQSKHGINSGSIIYTVKDECKSLIEVARGFFSSPFVYSRFLDRMDKLNKKPGVWGVDWIFEQQVYGLHMFSLNENLKRFGSVVNTSLTFKDGKPVKEFSKLPHIIHFLQRDKSKAYELCLPLVDNFINTKV
jgi:hypothetical protein